MIDGLAGLLQLLAWFALGYFLVLNTWYLGLLVLAGFEAIAEVRRAPFAGHDDIFHSPLAPPIAIVVPARNKEGSIVDCVRGLFHLRYPELEVIVVDDGSTDETFERLRETFDLAEVPRVIPDDLSIVGRVIGSYAPRNGEHLLVVRKESAGYLADAMNLGLNAARYPLVCRVDAESHLDDETLLAVAKPFIEDPAQVAAVGATIRVANGSKIEEGRVVDARMPKGWLPRIQAVEHLRSFLLGGPAWSRMQAVLFASGVFGLFRRDVLVGIGGLDVGSQGDDLEVVTRLHHHLRRARCPYRMAFVADPCCWIQVPSTYAVLARKRRQWAQTLAKTVWTYRAMLAKPRYGYLGLVVLPYYLVVELLGALVELATLPIVAAGFVFGVIDPTLALLFLIASLGYATFISILALAVDEFFYHRYRSWRDLGLAIFAAGIENLGYRQLNAWWRLRGGVDTMLRRPAIRVPDSPGAMAGPV